MNKNFLYCQKLCVQPQGPRRVFAKEVPNVKIISKSGKYRPFDDARHVGEGCRAQGRR